ncbi:probable mediator of RNA polymerase II transcription subunit 26b isoform X1 [Primulina huaijiensis]|uniref:probable mediator of RNA polymerase II transcription subunit 26b isoform X1 n=1 Tax=Primulina huaijiensis TaxID=1492673 RepID=UPI003CC7783E
MANSSVILDKWREYFRTANCDIFSIIEKAIMVAASDCPYNFKLKRDRIAEMLFTCKVTKCFGCDKIELAVPNVNGAENSGEKRKSGIEAGGSKDSKESKVNSCVNDDQREIMEMNANQVSNYSYGEAEALTDEIEEESQLYDEVMRIKEILDNSEEESDLLLFDYLRRLQLLPLSVEILKATEVGKSVNALRKHKSKEIRNLVRTLVGDWTVMVDAWVVSSTEAIAGAIVATESVKTSVIEEEEEGLPSPPLDEGAFFATPSSMELSQFFDGMDDDGNPRNSGAVKENRENGRRSRVEKPEIPKFKPPNVVDSGAPAKDRKDEKSRNQEPKLIKQSNRLHSTESGLGRRKPDKGAIQKKPLEPQQKMKSSNNEDSVQMKLEAAKRKLHERYQEAENAKKQRTIQVMEIHELPKQNLAQRSQNIRPGNHNRQHWANGRR